MLYPLVRAGRIASTALVFPDHQIQAIAAAELGSLVLPMLHPKQIEKIMNLTIVFLYCPKYTLDYLIYYKKLNDIYLQAEICFILLFISMYSCYYKIF